jgi:signal transduction histidine kinase
MDALLLRLRRHWPLALLAYLAAWTVPGLISASQLMLSYNLRGDDPPLGLVLGVALPGWYVWALLAPAIVWAARRIPLDRDGLAGPLLVHLGLNAVLAAVWVGLIVGVRRAFGLPGQTDLLLQLANALGISVLAYWAVVLIVHGLRFRREGEARALRAAELSAELSRARLAALQAQLHPHFLFNTMNAISAFLREDPEKAETMLEQLADLLRRVLEAPQGAWVALPREVEFLERYLHLQEVRLGDRLDARVEVEGRVDDVEIPAMVLQPLVENAVEHGIARRREGGRLRVRIVRADGQVTLDIEDDGPGLEPGRETPGSWRVGLGNTRERLRHLYGEDHDFRVANRAEGGVGVHVRLPVQAPGRDGRGSGEGRP